MLNWISHASSYSAEIHGGKVGGYLHASAKVYFLGHIKGKGLDSLKTENQGPPNRPSCFVY